MVDTLERVGTANSAPFLTLGKSIEGARGGFEMLARAGLNWEVVETPLYFNQNGMRRNPEFKALVRSDSGAYMSTVRMTYEPIQNAEVFEVAEALASVGLDFLRADELNGGRTVWAQARLMDRTIRIEGDDSLNLPFITIATGHDALRSFSIHNTVIRQSCWNQMNLITRTGVRVITVRHTKSAQERIKVAVAARAEALVYFDAYEATAKELVAQKMSIADIRAFTVKLIPSNPDAEKAYKSEAQRDEIIALVQNSANLRDVPMTAYRVINAVAEWADHTRPYRKTKVGSAVDARALALLDGSGRDIKDRAMGLLLPAGRGRASAN